MSTNGANRWHRLPAIRGDRTGLYARRFARGTVAGLLVGLAVSVLLWLGRSVTTSSREPRPAPPEPPVEVLVNPGSEGEGGKLVNTWSRTLAFRNDGATCAYHTVVVEDAERDAEAHRYNVPATESLGRSAELVVSSLESGDYEYAFAVVNSLV